MDQVAKGQYAALEVIYDRYANLVYSLAMRVLGEPDGAREVVQDTFVRVWEESAGFGSERAFDVWLLNRTRQVAVEQLRRRRARPQREGYPRAEDAAEDAGAGGLIDLQAGIERDPRATAYHRRIREVLQGLSKEQRRTIELCYFQGYTQEEISRLTGEPLGTVKARIRGSLRKLHEVARAEDARAEDAIAEGQ